MQIFSGDLPLFGDNSTVFGGAKGTWSLRLTVVAGQSEQYKKKSPPHVEVRRAFLRNLLYNAMPAQRFKQMPCKYSSDAAGKSGGYESEQQRNSRQAEEYDIYG